MTKVTKTKMIKNMIARMIMASGNNNIAGSNALSIKQAQKSKALSMLFHELESICGERQAQDIINSINNAYKDEYASDCMPLYALSETLQFARSEVRKSIKAVRKTRLGNNVVGLDASHEKQRLEQVLNMYWVVMHAFYPMYNNYIK